MSYIADRFDFKPVTLSAEQHRSFAEATEDLISALENEDIAAGYDAVHSIVRIVGTAGEGTTKMKEAV